MQAVPLFEAVLPVVAELLTQTAVNESPHFLSQTCNRFNNRCLRAATGRESIEISRRSIPAHA